MTMTAWVDFGNRERLLRLLPRRRLLPLRPEDIGVAPKILSTRVHPNPNPIPICPIFYNMPSILQMSYHHVALHLVGSGNSNIT